MCNTIIPKEVQYDAKNNPTGIRCDLYDHLVNVFGRDPTTGFARRPIDNNGVQYGLEALNLGAITKQQFLDLNRNIGGYDNDGNYVPRVLWAMSPPSRPRTLADASPTADWA